MENLHFEWLKLYCNQEFSVHFEALLKRMRNSLFCDDGGQSDHDGYIVSPPPPDWIFKLTPGAASCNKNVTAQFKIIFQRNKINNGQIKNGNISPTCFLFRMINIIFLYKYLTKNVNMSN